MHYRIYWNYVFIALWPLLMSSNVGWTAEHILARAFSRHHTKHHSAVMPHNTKLYYKKAPPPPSTLMSCIYNIVSNIPRWKSASWVLCLAPDTRGQIQGLVAVSRKPFVHQSDSPWLPCPVWHHNPACIIPPLAWLSTHHLVIKT